MVSRQFVRLLPFGIILIVIFKVWCLKSSSPNQLQLTNTDLDPPTIKPLPNSQIILYNRIPKTGSTTLANIFNGLAAKNKFWAVNINSSMASGGFGNAALWAPSEQREFLQNITTSLKYPKALYHGHFGYIQPDRWQITAANKISYINLVRDPLDRLASYYYFVRNGDNFRKGLKRGHAADHRSINECVAEILGDQPEKKENKRFNEDCSPKTLWKQVPMFCGQFSRCSDPKSRNWAYNQAVQNLYRGYAIVGTTERYTEFIELLSDTFPEYFSGAIDYIESEGGLDALSLRQTNYPDGEDSRPSERTIELLEGTEEFKYENMFYKLVKAEFDEAYNRAFNRKYGGKRDSRVNYNKIYGPDGRFRGSFRPY